ncbi:hypothetical protein NBRC3257_1790 [Gluconobacter thailandicus NBRC 3257]|uniref:Uncharacterized protein n=1 Tax=Gluconobacter thailandicus NBRC 3257 TaxID=1381097 RepID=A0ABQ0IX60_GLUTH|nr:hypothetical protein NBRC3257_1790 [Gluconobacter thailandicus NBRC 3257]
MHRAGPDHPGPPGLRLDGRRVRLVQVMTGGGLELCLAVRAAKIPGPAIMVGMMRRRRGIDRHATHRILDQVRVNSGRCRGGTLSMEMGRASCCIVVRHEAPLLVAASRGVEVCHNRLHFKVCPCRV